MDDHTHVETMSLPYLLRLLRVVEDSFNCEAPIPVKRPSANPSGRGEPKKKLGLAEFTKFAIPESQLPQSVQLIRKQEAGSSSSSTFDQEAQTAGETSASSPASSTVTMQTLSVIGDIVRLGDGTIIFGEKGDSLYAKCMMSGCWITEAVIKLKVPMTSANGQKTEKMHTYAVNPSSPYLLETLQSLADAIRLAKSHTALFHQLESNDIIDDNALSLLVEAQRALVFANALLFERNAPHWQTSGLATTKTFTPKLPSSLSIQFTVERLGLAIYIYSAKTRLPLTIYTPSPTIVLLSSILVDALQHVQVLIKNTQAALSLTQ